MTATVPCNSLPTPPLPSVPTPEVKGDAAPFAPHNVTDTLDTPAGTVQSWTDPVNKNPITHVEPEHVGAGGTIVRTPSMVEMA
jgi:hypothetical protein